MADYFKDKNNIWIDNNYHRMLKIIAINKGATMRTVLHDMIEDTWIKINKEK